MVSNFSQHCDILLNYPHNTYGHIHFLQLLHHTPQIRRIFQFISSLSLAISGVIFIAGCCGAGSRSCLRKSRQCTDAKITTNQQKKRKTEEELKIY